MEQADAPAEGDPTAVERLSLLLQWNHNDHNVDSPAPTLAILLSALSVYGVVGMRAETGVFLLGTHVDKVAGLSENTALGFMYRCLCV